MPKTEVQNTIKEPEAKTQTVKEVMPTEVEKDKKIIKEESEKAIKVKKTQLASAGQILPKRRIIMFFLLFAITIGLLIGLKIEAGKLKETNKEIIKFKQKQQYWSNVRAILSQDKDKIAKIDSVIPGEQNIIDFVRLVDQIASSSGLTVSFRFTAQQPVKVGKEQAYLPFVISARGNIAQLEGLIAYLKPAPYLIGVESLAFNDFDSQELKPEIVIKAVIYTQEPFVR